MRLRIAIWLGLLLGSLALLPPAPAVAAPAQQTTSACATAVSAAVSRVGYQYVWGAKGPTQFDCSGLTSWSWAQAGYNIGLGTSDQIVAGAPNGCSLAQLGQGTCWAPGDLVFLDNGGDRHVSMYIGNGLVVDAYNASTGVIVHAAASASYYQAHFVGGRRIVNCAAGDTPLFPSPSSPVGSITFEPPLAFTPSRAAPQFEDMPDILEYVSWFVPQCGVGIDDYTGPAPVVFWHDLGSVIAWLAYSFDLTMMGLTCWIAAFLQEFVNFVAWISNLAIGAVNLIWRLMLYGWLYANWLVVEWGVYLYEMQRDLLWDLRDGLQIASDFFTWLWDGLLAILSMLGQLVLLLVQMVMAGLGWLGWLGGMIIAVISPIFSAIFWTPTGQLSSGMPAVPGPLATTYPLYCGVRGALDGLHDSQIGWVLYLMYAMAYIVFVMWLSRFLSSAKAGPQ